MVDVALLIALYNIPQVILRFFTALGLAAIAVEILSPSIRYYIFRGRCQVVLARDDIQRAVILLRKGLHHRAAQVAALLEIKEDQSRGIGARSNDLKESSGDASSDVPDLKGCIVEHAQKTNRFDVEGWLLVVNSHEPGLCPSTIGTEAGKENSLPPDVDNGKMEENV